MFRSSVARSSPAPVEGAKRAVAITFAANGMVFGSWASRTPAVKSALHLDATGLGLLLVCVSIGSLTALPLSGAVVQRVGPGRAVLSSAVAELTGLLSAAVGLWIGEILLTGGGLVVTGLGIGTWDVAMNVEGADVERRLGRSVMSRFHAAWSLGSVGGAAVGAECAAVGISVSAQLLVTAVAMVVGAVVGVSRYLDFQPQPGTPGHSGPGVQLRNGWRDHRTLLIGLLVLAFAFTEGVANDWLALAVVDGLGGSQAMGAVGLGSFVTAMTVARLFGGAALDRWGRVAVLRSSVVLGGTGLLLVVNGPTMPSVLAGGLMWGAGTALGFPTGISAAADDVPAAAVNVSVVTSIGYTAFLAGPPLVGFLGDMFGIRHALYVVLVALALALATSGMARPVPVGRT